MSDTGQILVLAPGERVVEFIGHALAHVRRDGRIPHEIHVVGDRRVTEELERDLLQDTRAAARFSALCTRHGIPRDEVMFNRRTLHRLPIDTSPAACHDAVDLTVRLLRQLGGTRAAVTALVAHDAALAAVLMHASLHAVGRLGDRLLVQPPPRGNAVRKCEVFVPLEIPLLLPPPGDRFTCDYTDAVRQRQIERRRIEEPDVLVIDCRRRVVVVGDTTIRLPAMQFFWMYYLAATPGERFPLADLSSAMARRHRHPVEITQRLADGRVRTLPADLQRAFARRFPFAIDRFDAMLLRACGPHPGLPSTISKINAALRRALGRGAEPYLIEGARGSGGYRLNLAADRIQIVTGIESRRG